MALLLLLTYRYLLQQLDPDEFGLWALLIAIAGVARLADVGLGAAAARFVAADLGEKQPGRAARVVQTLAVTAAVVSGAVVVVSWLLSFAYLPWLVPRASLEPASALLPYMLASLSLQIVSSALLGGLEGAQRYDLRAGVVLAGYAVLLGGCMIFVPRVGLTGVGVAQLLQGAVTAVLAWGLVRHQLRVSSWLPFDTSRAELRRIATFSAGFQGIAIAQLAVELLVKLALSRHAGLAATGLFEVAQRMTQQLRAPLVAACQVLVPAVAEKKSDDPRLPAIYGRAARLMSLLSFAAFGALLIALPVLSTVLLGRFDPLLWTITAVLAVAWLVNALTAPAYFALLGLGTTRWHVLGHVVGAVVTAIFAWPLIDNLGVGRVVAAYALGLVLGSAVVVVIFHRRMRIPYRVGAGAGTWLVAALVIAGALVTRALAGEDSSVAVVVVTTLVLLSALAAATYLAWRRGGEAVGLSASSS